ALLETHIVRNYVDHDLLFQQTESALRYAESNLVSENIDNPVMGSDEPVYRQTVPFNSLETNSNGIEALELSTVELSRIPLSGSKVRGKGPPNQHSSLQIYRIEAHTVRNEGEGGIRLMSIVARGTQ
ncbi:MAG: hypothetical protein ACR2QW_15640, partial [bacterium]